MPIVVQGIPHPKVLRNLRDLRYPSLSWFWTGSSHDRWLVGLNGLQINKQKVIAAQQAAAILKLQCLPLSYTWYEVPAGRRSSTLWKTWQYISRRDEFETRGGKWFTWKHEFDTALIRNAHFAWSSAASWFRSEYGLKSCRCLLCFIGVYSASRNSEKLNNGTQCTACTACLRSGRENSINYLLRAADDVIVSHVSR